MTRRDALIGETVLGNYVVEDLLGRGAMGAIYRARHRVLGRKVAVKVLRHNLKDNPEERERFHAEAETIAKLSHPNVVTILDFGTLPDGSPCIVTEFINGQTISDILDEEGPIEPWRAAKLIQQVLSALIEAHSMGIVHRDIKCDNIMVQRLRDGREQVKLVDFGISIMEGRKNLDADYIFGTPLYMCPEQCRGEIPDGRGDLYSLGVVFFEMLTGEPLFYFENPYDYLYAHQHKPPPRPSEVADQPIPEAIEDIIMKLLEKDPKDRFQSAQEVKQALHQWEASRKSTDKGKFPVQPEARPNPRETLREELARTSAKLAVDTEPVVAILSADDDILETTEHLVRRLGFEVRLYPSSRRLVEDVHTGLGADIYLVGPLPSPAEMAAVLTQILLADPLAEVLVQALRQGDGASLPKGLTWAVSDFLVRPTSDMKALAGRLKAAAARRRANVVQSRLLVAAMKAVEESAQGWESLIDDLKAMLERTTAVPPRLAVLVSEPALRALERRGHQVFAAADLPELGRQLAKRALDGAVVETAPERTPQELASFVVTRRPDLEVLVVGFRQELQDLLEAVELGATDFVVRPNEDLEVFSLKVELAVARRRRRMRVRRLLRVLETLASERGQDTASRQLLNLRDALRETLTLEAEAATGSSPIQGLSGEPTALVAGPDGVVGSLLRRGLEVSGWKVLTAHDGPSAMEAIRNHELDMGVVSTEGADWPAAEILETFLRLQPQSPVALLGRQRPSGFQVPSERWLGFVSVPLTGLDQIRDLARRAYRRRKKLLNFDALQTRETERLALVLADPDEERLAAGQETMAARHCAVVSVLGISEAAEALDRYDVDAVVISQDLLLGADETELEAVRGIQAKLPVFAFGPPPDKTSALTLLTCGVDGLLPSPVEAPDHFYQSIKKAVASRREDEKA